MEGPDAGGIELRGRYTACRYAVGGDGSCGNLRGGDTAGIDSVGRDLRQLGIAAAAQSRGEGADRCRPQGTDRRGERDVARSVPRDVAARDRSGSRGIQPPFIAPDTVRAERNATCGRGAAPHSVVLRTPVKGVGIHRPAADFPFVTFKVRASMFPAVIKEAFNAAVSMRAAAIIPDVIWEALMEIVLIVSAESVPVKTPSLSM